MAPTRLVISLSGGRRRRRGVGCGAQPPRRLRRRRRPRHNDVAGGPGAAGGAGQQRGDRAMLSCFQLRGGHRPERAVYQRDSRRHRFLDAPPRRSRSPRPTTWRRWCGHLRPRTEGIQAGGRRRWATGRWLTAWTPFATACGLSLVLGPGYRDALQAGRSSRVGGRRGHGRNGTQGGASQLGPRTGQGSPRRRLHDAGHRLRRRRQTAQSRAEPRTWGYRR